MDFHSGPLDPGSPDGDPFEDQFSRSQFPDGGFPGEGVPSGSDSGEDGPFHPWLPPEDRLWRHPSEGSPVVRIGGDGPIRSAARLSGLSAAGAGGWRATCAIALVAGLVGAAAVSGVGLAGGWWHDTTVVRPFLQSTPVTPLQNTSAVQQVTWSQVDDDVAPSVVGITVNGAAGAQQGSGLLLFAGAGGVGYVVTDLGLLSASLEAGYVNRISVDFLSGDTGAGRLIGYDRLSGIAVIEVTGAKNDVPAATGTVATLSDASAVLALGARSLSSLATGTVSGQDRTVDLADGTDMDNLVALSMPAMANQVAGGALVDQFGEVVAITLALQPVDSSDQQFTFAEPIDEVKSAVSRIIEGRPVTHPWLGVANVENLPAAGRTGLSGGVKVGYIVPGSPAERIGITVGDVLTSFGGKPVTSAGGLVASLAESAPGTSTNLAWLHAGATIRSTVVIGTEPGDAP